MRPADEVLLSEQRRMAVLAAIACAWTLGALLLGAPEALGYLAPTLALIGLLVLGRYPGARAFERRLARTARRRQARAPRSAALPRVRRVLPRGGVLLAAGLAGRAPPLFVA